MIDPTTDWNHAQESHWKRDCMHQRGKVLTGKYRHWCSEWDELPVDETCQEWPCACFGGYPRPVAAPTHTDLMVTPESLDTWLAAHPIPCPECATPERCQADGACPQGSGEP